MPPTQLSFCCAPISLVAGRTRQGVTVATPVVPEAASSQAPAGTIVPTTAEDREMLRVD